MADPAGHDAHVAGLVDPTSVPNVPAGHWPEQAGLVNPIEDPHVPMGQGVGAIANAPQ